MPVKKALIGPLECATHCLTVKRNSVRAHSGSNFEVPYANQTHPTYTRATASHRKVLSGIWGVISAPFRLGEYGKNDELCVVDVPQRKLDRILGVSAAARREDPLVDRARRRAQGGDDCVQIGSVRDMNLTAIDDVDRQRPARVTIDRFVELPMQPNERGRISFFAKRCVQLRKLV